MFSSFSRTLRAGLASIAVLLTGCATYEPRPLALEAYSAAFFERTPAAARTNDAPGTFDLADGIDVYEAQAVALLFNPDLRSARLRAGIARASADNAGLWSDPVLGVDITRIIDSVDEPWKLATMVSMTIPLWGRLDLERDQADLRYATDLAQVAELEWRVMADVRRAWAERSALEARIAANHTFVEEVERVLGIVEVLERSGELPRAEARLFRIRRGTLDIDRAMLDARLAASDVALRRLLGLPPTAQFLITTTTLIAPRTDDLPYSVAEASTRLLEASPLLSAARSAYDVAEKTLELEVRRQYPDLTIGPGYGRDEGNDEVLLGLSLPLPILNANRRAIAEARAARDAARGEAERELEALLAEYAEADLRLRTAAARSHRITDELLPLIADQFEDARRLAAIGEFDALLLLESLDRRREIELALLEADKEALLARIRLEELLGPEAGPSAGDHS